MNLSESYKKRLQQLSGISNKSELNDFVNKVNKSWNNKIKADKTATPEDSILFGAICDMYELSEELGKEVLEVLNQHVGEKLSDNDEVVEKLYSIISRTTGEHPGPLNKPSSTSKKDIKDFLKTNED